MLAAAFATVILAPSFLYGVAVDGPRVAYADTSCRVSIWQAGRTTRLGATPCTERTSTGSGLAGLALAGGRALWVTYTGGNIREFTVWTATRTSARPRRLAFATGDVDAEPAVTVGDGDEDLLPYAVRRTVVVLGANGARRFAWTAPAHVTAVDAFAGKVAVATAGGLVTVLDGNGSMLDEESFGADVYALQISGSSIVAQVGRSLEVRDGSATRQILIRRDLKLVGAGRGRAALIGRNGAQLLDLDTGTRSSLGPARQARIDGVRVVTANGRRIVVR